MRFSYRKGGNQRSASITAFQRRIWDPEEPDLLQSKNFWPIPRINIGLLYTSGVTRRLMD